MSDQTTLREHGRGQDWCRGVSGTGVIHRRTAFVLPLRLGVVALTEAMGWARRLVRWSAFVGLAWGYYAIADDNLDDDSLQYSCLVLAAKWAVLLLWPPREARLGCKILSTVAALGMPQGEMLG
jgi:hypothetical protein